VERKNARSLPLQGGRNQPRLVSTHGMKGTGKEEVHRKREGEKKKKVLTRHPKQHGMKTSVPFWLGTIRSVLHEKHAKFAWGRVIKEGPKSENRLKGKGRRGA